MNENGELLADFCAGNELTIGGTLFPHRRCHKTTWVSPDQQTENQIDHIALRQRWRSSLQDVRAKREADIGSDHHLVIAKLKVKLSTRRRQTNPRVKLDVQKLKKEESKQSFQLALHNRFQALQTEEAEANVEESWTNLKEATVGVSKEVLGRRPVSRKLWISDETGQKVEENKMLKELNQARTHQQKQAVTSKYSEVVREVKKKQRRDRRKYFNEVADEAETAVRQGDLMALYSTIRLLSGRRSNPVRPVKDKVGRLLTSIEDQLARWKEHFQETLNRPSRQDPKEMEIDRTHCGKNPQM
uniref:Endonuclease/exonuclease/phosphatase domain-containing protein n=1 Tax=Octopus bimaculoides TaxID=37653 RepID=A0A0L8G0E8_OCTBM